MKIVCSTTLLRLIFIIAVGKVPTHLIFSNPINIKYKRSSIMFPELVLMNSNVMIKNFFKSFGRFNEKSKKKKTRHCKLRVVRQLNVSTFVDLIKLHRYFIPSQLIISW